MLDFRSDTVTKPTPQMLEAMTRAELGDDVLGDDPTVISLQEKVSKLFSKDTALFCPSGTMTNQIALTLLSGPLGEVIVEESNHVYQYEVGGIAYHARASVKLLQGERGKILPSQIAPSINPNDIHKPASQVLSIENTTNKGGGATYTLSEIHDLAAEAKKTISVFT